MYSSDIKFMFKQAIKYIADTTSVTLTKASTDIGRSSNFISSKIHCPSVRLNTAITIANAFKYELVLYPSSEPIPEYALVLKQTPEKE